MAKKSDLIFYRTKEKQVFAIGVIIGGQEHVTSDFREQRKGKDTIILGVSRTTLVGPKNIMQQCVNDDELCERSTLECEVVWEDVKQWGISHAEFRHPEIASIDYL